MCARAAFAQTISGTDLVVGARSGGVQLLLYAVFHLGNATNNVSWRSIEAVAALPEVKWLVPLSLGDSHRGYRVVGTTADFFAHYRHGEGRRLVFTEGRPFDAAPAGVFEAVIGAELAQRLGYRPGAHIVLSHGSGGVGGPGFAEHGDKPFVVTGVLARTGTPVDRVVLVGLEAIEAIHLDWHGGAPIPGLSIAPAQVRKFDLRPKSVTAALVGLEHRTAVFRVQRAINGFGEEPLSAILPGATLHDLWGLVGIAERALLGVSALVVAVGLAGLVAVMVASLGERRRELAILRSLGARPLQVFALLGAVCAASLAASLVPGLRAYRYSLADGMTIRI